MLAAAILVGTWGCAPGDAGVASQSDARVRAERRAYDGAPPTVPHEDMGMVCTECHNERGMPVDDLGFAPAEPHDGTAQAYSTGRCRQCHVFVLAEDTFAENDWVGLQQDLRAGRRLNALAPPTIPHRLFMRENCAACHTGPGARVAIATTHPERDRCRQCHVPAEGPDVFESAFGDGYAGEEGS
jgi:cytochrome c-type protein NapB